MPLLYVGLGILILLILMTKFKFDAFFALLITAFVVGLFNSMGLMEILNSMTKGIGDTMGSIILILTFGAMLGKIIEESGAAHTLTNRLIERFGLKNVQYVILVVGFLVGLPMMYNASFLVLIPLIYTFASTTKMPLLYLGIPLSATLSVAHGYLPPHPAPTYVSFVYGADINKVLLFGLILVVPACLIAGILLSKFFKNLKVSPPEELYEEKFFEQHELPSFKSSLLVTLAPVVLMLLGAVLDILLDGQRDYVKFFADFKVNEPFRGILSTIFDLIRFLSDANIALLMSVFIGLYLLGLRKGRKMKELMKSMGKAASSVAMIVLIIAAGGAFKQVLTDSGVADFIKGFAANLQMNPYVLAWCVAAIIRLAIGSATVATMTAAGIMLPIFVNSGLSPELMVLATGSGSLMFSHFNDIGFWMFKEYYNVTVKQTFAIWTVMECLVGIVGLLGVLAIEFVI